MPDAPPRRRLVAYLLAQLAFGLLVMTICIPSMQAWGSIFAADQARVQLSLSVYVLAFGGLQLLYGPLSDRLGRKPVLLGGLVLVAAGSLLGALAGDLGTLIAARGLQGAGTAAGAVVGRALVQDLFQGTDRTRVMGWVGMTMGLVPPSATLIGGQLHVQAGWQINFVLIGVLSGLLMLAAWRTLPNRPPGPRPAAGGWQALLGAYARLAREPAFLLYATISALSTAAFYAFLGGAPLVLGHAGVGPDRIGWYIMVVPLSYIAGNYLATRVVRRLGEQPMMWAGQALTVCALLLVLVLGSWAPHSPLAFAGPLALLGLGHGLLMPPTLAGTVGVVPALAGSAAAVAGVMQQLLGAFGAYTVGWVSHQGPVNLAALMLGFTLAAVAAQALLFRRAGRRG